MKYTNVEFLNVPYDEDGRYVPLYHPLPESWNSISATRDPAKEIKPEKPNEIFTRITVPINYNDIMNCNYMCATYHPSNGADTYKIYAWIDSIIPITDKKDTTVTQGINYDSTTIVNFHLDYWRMYIEKVKIGEGLVLNRPKMSRFVDPPQNIPVIYNVCGEYEYPLPGQMNGVGWVLMSYIHNDLIEKVAFPVDTRDTEYHIKYKNIIGEAVAAPSLVEVLNGKLLSALGVEREKLQSCSMSPIGPVEIIGKDDNNVLLMNWKVPTQTLEFKPTDFVENYEKQEKESHAHDWWPLGEKYTTYALTADHGNAHMSDETIKGIDTSTFPIEILKKENIKELIKESFNIWLNRNVFHWHEYFEYRGIEPRSVSEIIAQLIISPGILDIIGFAINPYLTALVHGAAAIVKLISDENRKYSFHTDYFTENIEYIPFIEWYKRYGGSFYENKQYVFSINQPAYLRKTDEKGNYLDRWKRKDEIVSLFPKREQTTYEPQDFIDKDEKILRLLNEGYITYAYFEDGSRERVYDYDVWIPNKETTINIDEVNDWKITTTTTSIDSIELTLIRSLDGLWAPNYNKLNNIFASNELVKVCLLDMRGQPIITFNEKQPLESITTEIITMGPSSSVLIRFNTEHAAANSQEVTIPCTPLEITQKYMNEYVLSGQRELDQQNLQLSLQQSITSAGTSAIVGAATGAITSGNPGAAGLGAVVGFGSSLANALVGNYFGNINQQQKEQFLQKRGSFLMRQASDYAWIKDGNLLCLALLIADRYSAIQYTNKVNEFGIDVNEFCYNIRLKEGPIRIINTDITGEIPIEAIKYIKNKLATGIYVDPELSISPNLNNKNIIREYD